MNLGPPPGNFKPFSQHTLLSWCISPPKFHGTTNPFVDSSLFHACAVEPPVSGHPWDQKKCPIKSGVHFGRLSVCLWEVSAYRRCPLAEVQLCTLKSCIHVFVISELEASLSSPNKTSNDKSKKDESKSNGQLVRSRIKVHVHCILANKTWLSRNLSYGNSQVCIPLQTHCLLLLAYSFTQSVSEWVNQLISQSVHLSVCQSITIWLTQVVRNVFVVIGDPNPL